MFEWLSKLFKSKKQGIKVITPTRPVPRTGSSTGSSVRPNTEYYYPETDVDTSYNPSRNYETNYQVTEDKKYSKDDSVCGYSASYKRGNSDSDYDSSKSYSSSSSSYDYGSSSCDSSRSYSSSSSSCDYGSSSSSSSSCD